MTHNTFYVNFEKQPFIDKKIFSNCIYSKHFVRNSLSDLNKIKIIDNYSNFTNIFLDSTGELAGSSFFPTRFLFKHKYNNILKFSFFLSYKTSLDNNETSKLFKSFTNISSAKDSLRLMLILNPVKGGFKAYSCGFLGFLPRSQNKIIIKNITLANKEKFFFLSNFSFFFCKNHITKLFFSICIPIKLTNTVIYPCYKTSNFSSNIAFRRRRFSKNHINFIFLAQGIKHNNQQSNYYEKSTIKKRVKSLSNKNSSSKKTFLHNRNAIQKTSK